MRIFCKLIIALLITLVFSCTKSISNYIENNRPPHISPDYTEIIIPPNIAPLNFKIEEEGLEFFIDIYGENKKHIWIKTHKNIVKIPIKKWKKLLSENRGKELYIDIYLKSKNNKWSKFQTIQNKIAKEEIDSYVVYRLINPGYVLWWEMGIYERNLENFKETPIFTNRAIKHNCINCHSFCNNNPEEMIFHIRGDFPGTILVKNGSINKINTSTKYTMSPGVYPSWHPNGNLIAFSVNKIYQSFHAQKDKSIYVWDKASDIIIYNIKTNTITTSPKVSTKRLENTPTWSPCGKYLYFTSAPEFKRKEELKLKYDLMRIPYDFEKNEWGEVEPVLTSKETGKSISFPRISPNGKFLLFCMSDYGYFSIHFKSSDLYMLDLKTKKYWKLNINSEQSESYHSWSSNSHWFVFASKREDGLCSRLYFSYVDSLGNAYKPFLMPQKDPTFYDTYIKNYNVPELIKGPIKISHWKLLKVTKKTPLETMFDSTVNIDALSGATKIVR
ncbi:MAG: hypothetical protein ABIN61_00805 [candidate division WOR-3 bacterium]